MIFKTGAYCIFTRKYRLLQKRKENIDCFNFLSISSSPSLYQYYKTNAIWFPLPLLLQFYIFIFSTNLRRIFNENCFNFKTLNITL